MGAGFLVHPPEGSDEPAKYLFGVVPKDEVELRGNWDVLGLGATASWDYGLKDAFIPENATFLFAAPTRRRGGPVYELGVVAQTAAGHAGFAIGVARRAIDELATYLDTANVAAADLIGTAADRVKRFQDLPAAADNRLKVIPPNAR